MYIRPCFFLCIIRQYATPHPHPPTPFHFDEILAQKKCVLYMRLQGMYSD